MVRHTFSPLVQEYDKSWPKGSLIHIDGLQGTASPKPTKSTPKAETKVKSQLPKKLSLKK